MSQQSKNELLNAGERAQGSLHRIQQLNDGRHVRVAFFPPLFLIRGIHPNRADRRNTGNITYNAPGGYHDDCVIALALANSERYQFKWTGEIRLLPSAPRVARLRAGRRALVG